MALKIFSPNELQARQESNRFLIDRFLPSSSVGVISGPPKVRKSWVCSEILVSLATGSKCFQTHDVMEKQSVLYLPLEDSAEIVRSRMELMAQGRGLSLRDLDEIHICPTYDFRLDDRSTISDLKKTVLDRQIQLIIIDPLVRCLGDVSENHSGQINTILSSLRSIQIESGATILLVHHNKKGGKTGGESLRGSSNLFSWIDFGLYCSKPAETVTQIDLQFKGFPEACPVFFELRNSGAGILPTSLGVEKAVT